MERKGIIVRKLVIAMLSFSFRFSRNKNSNNINNNNKMGLNEFTKIGSIHFTKSSSRRTIASEFCLIHVAKLPRMLERSLRNKNFGSRMGAL